MLVLAEWAVARASLPKHLLEEQTILSLKLLSERFSESHCNLLRLRFIHLGLCTKDVNSEGGGGTEGSPFTYRNQPLKTQNVDFLFIFACNTS